MADLVKNLAVAGVTAITDGLVAAASGQQVPNLGSKDYLVVQNTDNADHNVTLDSQKTCDQGADHDKTVSVTAGKIVVIEPDPPLDRWRDANGKLNLSWSATTGMKVGAFTRSN